MISTLTRAAALLLLALLLGSSAQADPPPTLIQGVNILDVRTGRMIEAQDVLLRAGRIDSIGPAYSLSAPAARQVDGQGHTLLPGLIDLHVHLEGAPVIPGRLRFPDPAENLQAMAAYGVTTVLDLGMSAEHLARWQQRVEEGRVIGPSIHGSGRPIAAREGHPRSTIRAAFPSPLVDLATRDMAVWDDELEQIRAEMAAHDLGFAKVMLDAIPEQAPTLSDEALQVLREASRAHDRRLLAHVGRPEDVARALAAPVDGLAHTPYLGFAPGQAQALADASIPLISTLAVWDAVDRMLAGMSGVHGVTAPVTNRTQQRDLGATLHGDPSVDPELRSWAELARSGRAQRLASVGELHALGGQVLLGSDSPNLGLAAGEGTQREVQLLRQAGLSQAEALAAATWHASRFLDPDARMGAVLPGWEADLMLVEGNPLLSPDTLREVVAVWIDGRAVPRPAGLR